MGARALHPRAGEGIALTPSDLNPRANTDHHKTVNYIARLLGNFVLIAALTGLAACERSPQVNALLVPAFYVAVERLAEWRKRPIAAPATPHGGTGEVTPR